MKPCTCKSRSPWYGMVVYLDDDNTFFQKCPYCKGRIELEKFNKAECDEAYRRTKS